MSNLGDTIKSVLGGGHSPEAERGEVDHRTPGAFPRDSDVHEGVDQPRAGTKPIPSSGGRDLGGTSEDPGFITGPSEHNKEGSTHNKLHKKDDPRGNTSYPAHDTSSMSELGSSKLGHSHTNELDSIARQREHNAANPFSSSINPSSHNNESLATDRSGRTGASVISGTGYTGSSTGLPSRESVEDRSGHRTEGVTGTSTGTTGTPHDLAGRTTGSTGTSGLAGLTGTGDVQSGSNTGNVNDHNKVGQRGVKSQVTSEDPYWGDLPQGAGVYNTVTGHGSGEDTSGQHRTIPKTSDTPEASRIHSSGDHHLHQGAGVYNTVTGHGSNRDADEHTASSGKREFPLSSSSIRSGETGTELDSGTVGSRVDNDSHRDRRIGEAGALGAGAAAYGAHEHNKHARDTTGPKTGLSTSGDREGDHGPHNSRIANTLDPRVDSDRDGSKTTGGTTSDVSGTGISSSSSGRREGDDLHRDRHLGGAGILGAGAAAYGAHEHNKHDKEVDRDNRETTQGVTGSGLEASTAGNHEGDNGPHNSRIANKLDPRVDSDRDESRTTGMTGTSSTAGTHSTTGVAGTDNNHNRDRHLGEAGALGVGAAAYDASEHHKHPTGAEHNVQRDNTPSVSNTQHIASGLDPTSTNQPGNTSHSGGLLNRHNDQTKHVAPTEKDKTSHHHEHSGILGLLHRNKDPKDIDQPAHDKSHFATHHGDTNKSALTGAPSTTQTTSHLTSSSLGKDSDLGSDTIRSGHDGSHTGRNLAGYGAAAGVGYGASQLGHHDKDQQINNQYGSTTAPGQASSSLHAAVPGSHATTVTGQPHPLSGDNSSHAGRDLTGTTSHASAAPSSYSQESSYSQDTSSHVGRNLAGAGVAAGAGYEASRLAKHHNEPSIGQPNSSPQGASAGEREVDNRPHDSHVATALDARVDSTHGGNRTAGNNSGTTGTGTSAYNKLSDGTPSGVATSNLGSQSTSTYGDQTNTDSRSATSGDNYNHLSGSTPSGVAASTPGGQSTSTYGNQSGTTSQTTSSSGDNYNHLAGGTPSGVAASTLGGQTTSTYGNQSGTTSQLKSNSGDNYNHLSSGTPSGVQLNT